MIRIVNRVIQNGVFFVLIAHWNAGRTSAQLPTIEITSLSRSGGKVGEEFDLHITSGNRLDEVDRLWFSDASITAAVATDPPEPFGEQRVTRFGHFHVTIPPDVMPGRYDIRAIGRFGVSNPLIFHVTELPWSTTYKVSHSADEPTLLEIDQIVSGQVTSAQLDYFEIELGEDETVTFKLLAQTIGSRMIGRISVSDSSGTVLASQRGADDIDPQLVFAAPRSDRYRISVQDFLFRGGNEYFYELFLRSGDARELGQADVLVSLANRIHKWHRPDLCTINFDPEVAMRETFESTATTELDPPALVLGAFDSPDDQDDFEFEASKGERLQIDIASSRLGEPSDPRWLLQSEEKREDGSTNWVQIQTADDGPNIGDAAVRLQHADPVGLFKIPKTGRYRLSVSDLDTGQSLGAQQFYRLSVAPPRPDFHLVGYRPFPNKDIKQSRPHGSMLRRGGTESIRVFAVRHGGWSGPIRLAVRGLPEGVICGPATLAANQTSTQVTLAADEHAEESIFEPRVIGQATVEGHELSRQATPVAIEWGRGSGREFIRSRLITRLVAYTTVKDVAPLSINIGDGSVMDVKRGETISLPIKLTRREGGKSACVLRARDLPPNSKVGDVTIAADKSEGTFKLSVSAKSAPGTYSFWLQAETKIKFRANPQALERAKQRQEKLKQLQQNDAAPAERDALAAAIIRADDQVKTAEAASKQQELTVYIPSPHVTIRIVGGP